MKEKKTGKRAYMDPVCESFAVEAEQLLQAAATQARLERASVAATPSRDGLKKKRRKPLLLMRVSLGLPGKTDEVSE